MTAPTCETCKHYSPNYAGEPWGYCRIVLPRHVTKDSDTAVGALASCSLHAPIPETDRTSD